jgi:hypothetical protein
MTTAATADVDAASAPSSWARVLQDRHPDRARDQPPRAAHARARRAALVRLPQPARPDRDVIDPAIQLGYRKREVLPTSRLVILKTNADLARLGLADLATDDELAGLWIDRISDVITVAADQITPAPPDQSGVNDHLISAIVQRYEQVIRLVEPSALLRHGISE